MKIDKTAIQSAIQAALDSGTKQAELARYIAGATGQSMSDATLSNMRKGEWSEIADKKWRQVALYFNMDVWQIVATSNFNTVQAVCRDAQQRHRMRVIAAYAGAGKTTSLKHYRTRNTNAFYVLCQKAMTQKELLRAIARSMGIKTNATTFGLIENIAQALNNLDSPVLLLDDFGKLDDRRMLLIQQIRDLTEDNAGIVLAGVDYVYDNLIKGVNSNKVGFPELMSRMGTFQGLAKPTLAEVKAIAANNGIDDEGVASLAHKKWKEFRAIRNHLEDLMHYARTQNKPASTPLAKELWNA